MSLKGFLIFPCLLLLLTACPPEWCGDPPPIVLNIIISDSTQKHHVYAHGIGKEDAKIYSSFKLVYVYDSVKHTYTKHTDLSHSMYDLEVDISNDTCRFRLVNDDLTADTLTLRYTRKFYANEYCDGFTFSDLTIQRLSGRFIRDSSFIRRDNMGTYHINLKK
jgi:hypothetical protein